MGVAEGNSLVRPYALSVASELRDLSLRLVAHNLIQLPVSPKTKENPLARKSLGDLRAEKLAQLETLKQEIAALEAKAAERIAKLAIKTGLADLNLDEDTLAREFQTLVARFQGRGDKEGQADRRVHDPA